MKKEKNKLTIYTIQETCPNETAFAETGIKAGFPSPAQDFIQEGIDLNRVLAPHPDSIFIVAAQRSMSKEECIDEGNLLVIDQSLKPTGNRLVAYTANGEFSISNSYPAEDSSCMFWGVLSANIRIDSKHNFRSLEVIPQSSETNRKYPSFVQEYMIGSIDLNKVLIKNAPTTFITVVDGESMIEECIGNGDLLIIDKSLDPYDGCLAACYIDGDFTLKKVRRENDYVWLLPANPAYQPIKVTENNDFIIWGIVTSNIKFYNKFQ